jgi:chromosome segregation ATPase
VKRLFLAVLGLTLLAGVPAAPAQVPAPAARASSDQPAEQIDAYVALVQADQARNRGQWKTAIQQYREAMKQYGLLVEKHPNWNPEIVQYRLTYCGNEVQAILQKTGKTEAELLAGQAITPEDENASYKDRFEAVRRDYEKTREELAQLRKDIALKEAVAKAQTDDARRTEADNNRLRLALAAAQGQTDRNATELEQRRAEVTQHKALLEEARNAIERLQREKNIGDQARFEAEKQLAEQNRTLAETRRSASDFETRADGLEKQLGTTRNDVAVREQQIRSLTNELARISAEGERLQRELKATGKVDAERYKKMADEARAAGEQLASRLALAQKEISNRIEAQATLIGEQKRLTNTVQALKKDLADTQRERDQLKAATERFATLADDHKRATNDLLALKAQVAADERTIAALRKDVAAAKELAGSAAALQERLVEATKKGEAQKAALALTEKERDTARAAAEQAATDAVKARKLSTAIGEERAELSRKLTEQTAAADKLAADKKALQKQISDAGEGMQKVGALQLELTDTRQKLATTTAELENVRKAAGDAPKIREQLTARELELARVTKELQTLQAEVTKLRGIVATGAKDTTPAADATKLKADLAAARDEVKALTARHESLTTATDGLKTRLAELNSQMIDRDKQSVRQQQEHEMLKAQYDSAKANATEAAGRAAKFEKQLATLSADRAAQEEQLKKSVAALSETVDLRETEIKEARATIKDMRDQLEQLVNANRLLQNENARLKK